MFDPSLPSLIVRLPKVELHLHLEGAVRPEALRELARRKGRLERETEDWVRARERDHYRYGNFPTFLDAFKLVTLLLETPEDYALATTRLLEELARQNVKYAEIILAAGVILWKNQSLEAIFDAVREAASQAERQFHIRTSWIFDAIRHFGPAHVQAVARRAARYRSEGVVALGIGGDEARGPAEWFTEVYHEARQEGLHLLAHAGEVAGPESVRKAVELLGVERIGHGGAAAQDPAVMALLRERRIPLEVCLTSNVATGVLARLQDHPLPRFLESGLVVTLNSDDPAMFGTSLESEFRLAAMQFGLERDTLLRLGANSIRSSFLGEEAKAALLKDLAGAAEGAATSEE